MKMTHTRWETRALNHYHQLESSSASFLTEVKFRQDHKPSHLFLLVISLPSRSISLKWELKWLVFFICLFIKRFLSGPKNHRLQFLQVSVHRQKTPDKLLWNVSQGKGRIVVVVFSQLKIFDIQADRHLLLFYLIFSFCTKKHKNPWAYVYFYCTSTTQNRKQEVVHKNCSKEEQRQTKLSKNE